MDLKNNYWIKNSETVDGFFDKKEIALITSRIKSIKKIECLVFCSFESRFAKSGGLAAVTTKILPYLKEVNNISNVILLTPFYPNIIPANKLKPTEMAVNGFMKARDFDCKRAQKNITRPIEPNP